MIKKSAPKFWQRKGLLPLLFSPASFFYAQGTARAVRGKGYRPKAKTICIGNLTVGGSGKTPTAIAIAQLLQARGKNVHFISKGYGRKSKNIGTIKIKSQPAEEVGDEPLLLAQTATTWVSDSRADAAKQADAAGADVIIMDDGFQNSEVEKDFSLIVIDGGYGFGNGKIMPAGPLRESPGKGLKRADAILVIGEPKKNLPSGGLPVFHAKLEVKFDEVLKEESIVAFCGIGRPEKFFDSLREAGLNVVEELAFPDHHFYNDADYKAIFGIANSYKAVAVTTLKDIVKIPDRFRKIMYSVKAELVFKNGDKLLDMILEKVSK